MKQLKSSSTESKISLTLNKIGRLHILLLEYGGLIAHSESHFWTFVQFLLRLQANVCFLFFTSTYFVKIITTALEEGTYEVETVAEWVGMCGAHIRFVMASMRRNVFHKLLCALCDCCVELSHSEIKIVRFCKNIEDLTSALYMSQLVSTSYNMSLIGFRLVQPDADASKYISVLLLLLIQQFICQWGPDVLVSESESFAQSTYFVPNSGYVNKRTNQLIHIMMIKCQHPIHLTAGGFFKLSMKCFGSLVTNTISFFMVLQTINSEK